ncbi:hypothetical protein FNV43_RR06560 [Rhamnella rubrinervis]|uniref:non-specific serine/threonine protein kinase n=1 Tax=Rhamnella rubrinervis TaxID=2594499 RepID=A0A8K0HDA4_9ROSA|nr:hypothetical protein FNV43_RR06560 [Rhamnella rubrinervis]
MIGVGKIKQYSNEHDKPLVSKGKQERVLYQSLISGSGYFETRVAMLRFILSVFSIGGFKNFQQNQQFVSSLTIPSFSDRSNASTLPTPRTEGEIFSSPNLKAFLFNELKNANRNFRPNSLLGEGGFGYVFKGWIDEHTMTAAKPASGMVVAVKKLKPEGFQGHKEWLTEVNYLGQLHHPNLVKLIGYCLEGENRLLVYEFMPKGSLENHLFRRGPQPLSWAVRMKVAIGAARGLSFLHDAESQVIYRDFKASNILLDAEFNAKLWLRQVLLVTGLTYLTRLWVLKAMQHLNMLLKELLGMVSQGMLLKKFSLATAVVLLVLAAATARQQPDWTQRCGNITNETAVALAYLHSATSTPIIHRDVKTGNILLDEKFTTKVLDFGASRLMPTDQNKLSTVVQGTFGYLVPEYMQSTQLTEKSDVYSFGVVLAELLTGKKVVSFERPEEERSLAMLFVSALKDDRLLQIIDDDSL